MEWELDPPYDVFSFPGDPATPKIQPGSPRRGPQQQKPSGVLYNGWIRLNSYHCRVSGVEQSMTQAISQKRGIQMTDSAVRQVLALRERQGKDLCLRVGVRQGGCSGMSYVMDFADPSTVRADDEVFDYEGFQVVCDRKSILYLYGLVLDFSDAMIGGGFQFTNPNATQTCGCGSSFAT